MNIRYKQQEKQLPLIVVEGQGASLFGRNWLRHIRLQWEALEQIELSSSLNQLIEEYSEVFASELGTVKGVTARLEVHEGTTPICHKPRSVPYSLKEKIERDLDRLEKLGVIEKVPHSEWAAPIVPVPKSDGGIRLCGDYKVTVNPYLKIDQYPVPSAEDLFAKLAGGQTFTKLDLSHAYQQVVLEEESRKYVTVTTHKGLYRYKRLHFGIASAPAVFQRIMEQILQGIPRVVVYLDDLLITGRNEAEHLDVLKQVLERLRQYGLRLKRSKCKLMQEKVEYLGYMIDKDGLHTVGDKIRAIKDTPQPQCTKQLRAFLGLVQYYGRFIPMLSTHAYPLNQLLRKGVVWKWGPECDKA